ncbi:MAG: NAD(P)H-dependent glycerol-3-phosphate dehydrogenase [Pseudomonadota bacterium]
MPKISIIGKGAFGTALHTLYSNAGNRVHWFGRDIPDRMDTEYVFLAVPSHSVREVLQKTKVGSTSTIILCCKGFLADGSFPSSLVPEITNYAVLSGPGFADELAQALPTVHSIAALGSGGEKIASDLSLPSFRLYWSTDPIGVQTCGALKNILAIAVGMTQALELGENARAALIARGTNEFRHAVNYLGGREDTLWSPAGLGDLILTCTSPKSRNFRFGKMIANGVSVQTALSDLGTVEGYSAVAALLKVVPAERLPVVSTLDQVLRGEVSPEAAIKQLMSRPITHA